MKKSSKILKISCTFFFQNNIDKKYLEFLFFFVHKMCNKICPSHLPTLYLELQMFNFRKIYKLWSVCLKKNFPNFCCLNRKERIKKETSHAELKLEGNKKCPYFKELSLLIKSYRLISPLFFFLKKSKFLLLIAIAEEKIYLLVNTTRSRKTFSLSIKSCIYFVLFFF